METDKIRAAILDKAQKEAEEITVSARLKAEELITNANEQKKNGSRRRKTDYIRGQTRGIEDTGTILPQGTQEILRERDAVINKIITKVKEDLSKEATDEGVFLHLINEALEAFETKDKLRLLVSQKDISIVRKVVEGDDALKEQIAEVSEFDCMGALWQSQWTA